MSYDSMRISGSPSSKVVYLFSWRPTLVLLRVWVKGDLCPCIKQSCIRFVSRMPLLHSPFHAHVLHAKPLVSAVEPVRLLVDWDDHFSVTLLVMELPVRLLMLTNYVQSLSAPISGCTCTINLPLYAILYIYLILILHEIVGMNGWIVMTEFLWKIMEIVALCVWISMAKFFREKMEKSGRINGYSQLNFSGCVC